MMKHHHNQENTKGAGVPNPNRSILQPMALATLLALGAGSSLQVMAGQGIEISGGTATLYFDDEGWTGSWNYLCVASNCVAGAKSGSRWERDVTGLGIVAGNSYDVQIKIQDNATGQYISPMYTVVAGDGGTPPPPPPNTPPSVDIVADTGLTTADIAQISVNASDDDGDAVTVALYATAPGGSEQLVGSDSSAPYQFSITNLVAGTYGLRAVATDDASPPASSEDTDTMAVTQAGGGPVNQAPNITLATSSDNTPDGSALVSVNATDPDGDNLSVELFVTPPGGTESSYATDSAAPYSFEVNNLVEGVYQVRAVATDDGSPVASAQATGSVNVSGGETPPDGDYGYEATGTSSAIIWFASQAGWPTAGDYYLCKNGEQDCYRAELVAGRWQYEHTNLAGGATYSPQLKVPGFGASDFPTFTFTFAGGNDGGNPGGGDPDSPFAHLDWQYNSHNSTENMIPHNDNSVGPAPYTDGPDHMRTPSNGASATAYGFAFDLSGSTFSWRWGPGTTRSGGDSGLEVYCSEDNGATYEGAAFSGGSATVSCDKPFIYFFRYVHPNALNNNPASAYIYTGSFTTAGPRVPLSGGRPQYDSFTDGSANWMRFRHPISADGTTAAVLDAQHNNDALRNLDRYTIWVDDAPGNVNMRGVITGEVLRNEAMRNPGSPNGQQFFSVNTEQQGFAGTNDSMLGWGDLFSYGQVIQFEITAVAGATGAQTYNDFSYYTVGQGWGAYGDVRLNSAGKAGTTMWVSDAGAYIDEERNAVFTQPFATVHDEQMIDDFIVGHHLFHGVDPRKLRSSEFDDPDVQIGERTCGNCHFRDGRGSEVIMTAKGPRLPMPTYGVKLLEMIDGRQTGFTWDGSVDTVAEQVVAALENDHGVDFSKVDEGTDHPVVKLITDYTELLTVPNRDPGAYDDPDVVEGDKLFTSVGCASCHTPVQKTRADAPSHLRNLTIRPYTDMKTWDLGEGEFRTPALWGLGHNIQLLDYNDRDLLWMHDGASTTLEDAIQRHGGDAASVRSAYNGLSAADRQAIRKFVKTL